VRKTIKFFGKKHLFFGKKNNKRFVFTNIYCEDKSMGMAPFIRIEVINKADELVKFARSIFDEKRSSNLRKAAKLYRDATLSFLAEIIEKEADDWDIWTS
jgi:hypothetical protein